MGAEKNLTDECIIALTAYDSCKRQQCLTHKNLGPSRTSTYCSGNGIIESSIVRPPKETASVTVDDLSIKKIFMQKKRPNPSKIGYWDLNVGIVFAYILTFWDTNGCVISHAEASNTYTVKAMLYGATGNDMMIFTDFCPTGIANAANKGLISTAAPYIWMDANAICLDAEVYRNPHHQCHDEVWVKIGLFSVIKTLGFGYLILISN